MIDRLITMRRDLSAIALAQDHGDTLRAYDLAVNKLPTYPEALALQYHIVLALASAGLTDKALTRYDEQRLADAPKADLAALAGSLAQYRAEALSKADHVMGTELNDGDETSSGVARSPTTSHLEKTASFFRRAYEDVATLGARLAKDKTWSTQGMHRRRYARLAAQRYTLAYQETSGFYSGINAAVMYLFAGDPSTGASMAERVLAEMNERRPVEPEEAFAYAFALTQAYLLTGSYEKVIDQILKAFELLGKARPNNLIAASTMKRQLEQLCRQLDENVKSHPVQDEHRPGATQRYETLLAKLPTPTIIHYCGHMISVPGAKGRFPYELREAVQHRIEQRLTARHVSAGFGSLACGSDILFAEALIKRGAELHVVLPFTEAEFIDTSVRRGGDEWIGRFQCCLASASSVTYATTTNYLGDVELFAYGSHIAMGMAMLRAKTYGLDCFQLAVSDEVAQDAPPVAGTVASRNIWERTNKDKRDVLHIRELGDTDNLARGPEDMSYSSTVPSGQGSGRTIKAILFGDIKGFSSLEDDQLPAFWDIVIGMFSEVMQQFDPEALATAEPGANATSGKKIKFYNTWGDGIFVVVDSVSNAAALALLLQEAMRQQQEVFEAAAFPPDMSLRLGGHLGPVFRGPDRLLGKDNWYGSSVARAARIEPITPPGEIYVTEPFAATLALEAGLNAYDCEYDGEIPTAKGYGQFRMYRLRRGKAARPSVGAEAELIVSTTKDKKGEDPLRSGYANSNTSENGALTPMTGQNDAS